MEIYGKVINTIPKDRIVKVLTKNKIYYLYLPRKLFKDFGPYFIHKPYAFINMSSERKQYGKYYCHEITNFIKIIEPTIREKKVYYNINTIRKSVKRLIEKTKNKLFLDLEFSLPSYIRYIEHVPEIIQYGMVLEDELGNIIFEDGSLVRPIKKHSLNPRTLKFLSKAKEDFDNAIPYIEFYQLLEKCIEDYDVKVIAWGRNDILTLEQSFQLNHLMPLDIKNRYMNIMQIIKNYYNSKSDLGLFNTYELMTGEVMEKQSHDALEDALMTREIYRIFKDIVTTVD
jgi:inhibitor of KinA sporulation pathway (predicted exonuclease)